MNTKRITGVEYTIFLILIVILIVTYILIAYSSNSFKNISADFFSYNRYSMNNNQDNYSKYNDNISSGITRRGGSSHFGGSYSSQDNPAIYYEQNTSQTELNTESYPIYFVPMDVSTEGDWIPDISSESTIVINESGPWSEILRKYSVSDKDIIEISQNSNITYDLNNFNHFKALVIKGNIIFDSNKNTRMDVETIEIQSGSLIIKPNEDKKAEIYFLGNLDTKKDPGQISVGLISACKNECFIDIEGTPKEPMYTSIQSNKGDSIINVSLANNWKTGDELILTDTQTPQTVDDPTDFSFIDIKENRTFSQQEEIDKINKIDGNYLEINSSLEYSHLGYIADVSRNVIIASNITNKYNSRAHIMFTGNSSVKVENVKIIDLGRTTINEVDDTIFSKEGKATYVGKNQRGRYALHAHHLKEVFYFKGNVIMGSPKWGIVNHDSTGEIQNNIVIGAEGGGIVGEDGTETGIVKNNIVIGTGKGSGEGDDERFGKNNGKDLAHGGFGFWFRGPFLNITDNVAAGYFKTAGFAFFLHPGFTRSMIRMIDGTPIDLKGKSENDLVANYPLREFKNNVADGLFGLSALSIEYSKPVHTINNFSVLSRGNSSSYGISLTHINSLNILYSNLSGSQGYTRDSYAVREHFVNQVNIYNSTIEGYSNNITVD